MALTDKLTAIADAVRGKTGGTESLTLDRMVTAITAIETGGGKSASGTVTPTNDTFPVYVELDFVPSAIAIWIDDYANKALDGVAKALCGCYYNGLGYISRTGNDGVSFGLPTYATEPQTDLVEDVTRTYTPYIPRPVKTGGFQVYHNFKFKVGYTYNWEAME